VPIIQPQTSRDRQENRHTFIKDIYVVEIKVKVAQNSFQQLDYDGSL